jgi:branched-chain amino acid transport system permease protein
MTLGALLVQLLSGLTAAAIVFLVSVGITLIFGALRIINVAHGSFYMYGAFAMAVAWPGFGSGEPSFWVRLLIIPLGVGLLGAIVEIAVLRRIYKREHMAQLLATFALFYIFADLAQDMWGKQYYSVTAPAMLAGPITISGYSFPAYSLFVIAVAIFSALLLFVILRLTMFGWRVRAAVEDPELLAGLGTNVSTLSTMLFALGTALAGLAGAVVAPLQAVSSGMDASILVAAFIVSIVGGLGSVVGSVIGSIVIGIFQAFGVLILPQWSSTFMYVVLVLLLAFRPAGLMGRTE